MKVLENIDIFIKARKADMGELQKWIRKSLDNLAHGGDEVIELVTPDGIKIRISGDLRANINLMDETGDMLQDTVRVGEKAGDGGDVAKTFNNGSSILSKLQGTGKVGDFSDIRGQSVEEIISRIPKEANMRVLQPVEGKVQRGVEFSWKVNGKTMRVRIHDIDLSAPSGSNAANGWIVRVQEGKKYLDPDSGIFQPPGISNPDSPFYDSQLGNSTHIPIETPREELINELIGNN